MEIMEDGNLLDKVRILLQRDMQYYQDMQTVLREPLCVQMRGGHFDFPSHASFAAIKIVTWWDDEFMEVFQRPSGLRSSIDFVESSEEKQNVDDDDDDDDDDREVVVKKMQPGEFIMLVIDTAHQFMDHLHTLIQESLDHADLTVLTATLGAAALVRNCLWCYKDRVKDEIPDKVRKKLKECNKSYNEMAEAVAERLLDLHNRLIQLYILMEAESCGWESDNPFFERTRSSYIIQMWWLYMQGTKADLWSTVSPKMAQRIFSGVLNDSLTILVIRLVHGKPSYARSMQFWADGFNILCCTAHLSLGVFVTGDEMMGMILKKCSIIARDIHAKCTELLVCLLLRGGPLKILYQVFRDGLDDLAISQPRRPPAPWVYAAAPELCGITHDKTKGFKDLTARQATILELNILKSQPQACWTQVLKLLSMDNYLVSKTLLGILTRQCVGRTNKYEFSKKFKNSSATNDATRSDDKIFDKNPPTTSNNGDNDDTCGGFLCVGNSCKRVLVIEPYDAFYALTYILTSTGWDPVNVFMPVLKKNEPEWSNYLDKHQVWNQRKPPWLNAMLEFLRSIMTPIVETVLEAVKDGSTTFQAMGIVLHGFTELHVCVPYGVLRLAWAMDKNLPAHCRPIGGSVALQLLCAALYTAFIEESENSPDKDQRNQETTAPSSSSGATFNTKNRSDACLAMAEALCGIDEANKHSVEIDELVETIRDCVLEQLKDDSEDDVDTTKEMIWMFTDDILFAEAGKRSLRTIHEYLVRSSELLLKTLANDAKSKIPDKRYAETTRRPVPQRSLTHTMFNVGDLPFDRLLADYDNAIDWELMLEIPLDVEPDKLRAQVLARPEIANVQLIKRDDEREAADNVKKICTTGL